MDNVRKGIGRAPASSAGGEVQAVRRSVVFAPDVDALLRAVGYWERTTREELVGEAVRFYVAHLEKQRGAPYKPVARGLMGRPIGSGKGRPKRSGGIVRPGRVGE